MSSIHLGSMRPLIAADNKSSGSQFFADGHGDQNVALGNGVQYNDRSDRRNITIMASVPDMPSIWQAVNGAGTAIINWLMRPLGQSLPDARHRHVELLSQVTPGTGKWVLASDEFQAGKIRRVHHTFYQCMEYVNATALSVFLRLANEITLFEVGAGKSVLASLIIQAIEEEAKSQPNTACIYFYFQDGDDTLSPARFWAILLEQLLPYDGRGCIAAELTSKFNTSFQGLSPLHSSEYWGLFKAQTKMFKTVYLVLDAPDSYLGQNLHAWQSVWDALRKLPPNVRLLFTSRHDSLARYLEVKREIRVTLKVSDIDTYVKYRIERDTNLNRVLAKPQDRESVVNTVTTLTSKSGMFLLARLHLDNLSKRGTQASIKSALSHLPVDSNGVFGASILHITKKHSEFERKLAKHVLTWISHAKVGLTVNQVQDSFAMQQHSKGESYREHRPSEDSVISVGAGLIIKDSEKGTLRLVHESAQKHLRKRNILLKDADLTMAKTCLTCLLVEETGDDGQSPLLSYAASYWISHLGNNCQGADAEASGLVKDFIRDSTKLARAFNAIPTSPGSGLGGITGLHAAVYFNLLSYAKNLIKARFDVNARCSNGQTALHWAVRLGRRSLLNYLIRKSADTNIRDRTNDTPLHLALKGPVTDNIGIVQDLVAGGAKLDIPGAQGLTALSWTIRYGPTAVAEILLKSQNDVNGEISLGWTSLRELFCHDHSNVQPPGTSADRWTSLRHAVEDHVRYLIDVVLNRGVDLNLATSDGWLPLIHAIMTRSLSRIRRLLKREPLPADVNKRDPKENWSPLRWAFFCREPAIIRLLVEHRACVNENNDDGWTPLIQAVWDDNEDIVWLLLKMGARPETLDNKKSSALLYAIKGRNKNIVWLLANSKANIRLHSNILLELTLANNDYSIAWLLCEHGADPNATDEGMTLLHRASRRGRLGDVSFLLDRGADVSHRDNTGYTPLHLAVLGGFDSIVAELASRASRQGHLEIRDANGNTALILATLERRTSMVQTLLHHQASCETPGPQGLTALHHAARLGFNDGLQLMIRRAGDVNLVDDVGYSAVHHVVTSSDADAQTIHILEAGGADLNAKAGRSALTPLMLAKRLGKNSFVRQLQEKAVLRRRRAAT